MAAVQVAEPTASRLRRFTVEEYHLLGETGILAPWERVELIRGVLHTMSPKGDRHIVALSGLIRIFSLRLADRASVYVQDPLRIRGWHSEPEPDLQVTPNPDPAAFATPAAPVLLVVEVADSSLAYDRGVKAPLYAEAEIPEYWIVNLVDDAVEVFREPASGRFQVHWVAQPGDRLAPLAWPDLVLDVGELLPPVRPL